MQPLHKASICIMYNHPHGDPNHILHRLGLAQCASELPRKPPRRLNRSFTSTNRSHTSRSNDHPIRHFPNFPGLLGRADSKSHTHRHGRVLTHLRDQPAKSLRQGLAFARDTCHRNEIDKSLGVPGDPFHPFGRRGRRQHGNQRVVSIRRRWLSSVRCVSKPATPYSTANRGNTRERCAGVCV